MVRLIEGETGKYMELPGGIALSVSYKDAIIAKKMIDFCPFPVIDKPFNVNIPGSTKVDNWRVNGSIITAEDNRIKSDYIAYFDMDSIKCSSMMVRTRRTGDIFQPIGMRSSKKLKNFMIDSKIPSAWRSRIPVVESEGKILWVVGYRISDWAKIQEKTEKILALSFCSDQ
jgi:tRNA(Ile)-lysidine synthase